MQTTLSPYCFDSNWGPLSAKESDGGRELQLQRSERVRSDIDRATKATSL